jgi:hypothetical protein
MPFAPSGFLGVGVSVEAVSKLGNSAALGNAYVVRFDVSGVPNSSYSTPSNNACAAPCAMPPCT